ncbi:MAG: hypothetical protein NVS1B13_19390 [Flavisolibacter sp.]
MEPVKLFMLLLGCTPPKRHTEQHDIFFGIGESIASLKQEIIEFWPEAHGKIHIDAWRQVNQVDGYKIQVLPITNSQQIIEKLFFINLGGYKINEFDEFHYKMLVIGGHKADAINKAKKSAFYRHFGFKGAESHIDDKYGVDVDEVYQIEDILDPKFKEKYKVILQPASEIVEDQMHLGYLKLNSL